MSKDFFLPRGRALRFFPFSWPKRGQKNSMQVSIGEAYVKSHRELKRGEKFSQRT